MNQNPFAEDYNPNPISEEDLKNAVKKNEEEIQENLGEVSNLNALEDLLAEEEARIIAQAQELKKRKQELERKKNELRQKARKAQADLVISQRHLETFISDKVIREKIEREREAIENRTVNSQWRKFARGYQIDAASRLASAKRGFLGDQTGLGKTVTSIIWMDMIQAERTIILAPKDVLANFEREIHKWDPERKTLVLQGKTKPERDMILGMVKHLDKFTILTNYEAWRRDQDFLDALIDLKADTLICDEVHVIRNGATKSSQGVRDLVYAENACNVCGSDIESAVENKLTGQHVTRCSVCFAKPQETGDFCSIKNVLVISATPTMNGPDDLYPPLNILDRNLFASLNNFRRDFCKQNWDGSYTFKPGGETSLIRNLGSRMVSRKAASIGVELPKQIDIPHILEFEKNLYTRQQQAIEHIRNMQLDMLGAMGREKIGVNAVIAMYTRLRQAITYPAGIKVTDPETGVVLYQCDVTESIIMDKVEEIVEAAKAEGDRVLVFSQFKEVLKEVSRRLTDQGITNIRLDGDTKDVTRNQIAIDFDSKSADEDPAKFEPWDPETNPNGYKWQVCLAHYKVGGVGLNLDLARQVVIADMPWNYGTLFQAINRTRRVNTKHESVVVHTIHVQKSVTTWLDSIVQAKREISEGLDNDLQIAESFLQAMENGFQ